jgi:hypothetical protein
MAEREPAADCRQARTGSRGGTTTWSRSGLVRKNFWLPEEVEELLRRKSFEERRSQSDLIREGLERLLGMEKP